MDFREEKYCDALVIGSGLAGLNFALELSSLKPDAHIILVTKAAKPEESASRYAQGGIATVFSVDDSFQAHVQDTLQAGVGLCNSNSVEICVKEGPHYLQKIIHYGVPFSKRQDGSGEFDLTQEGGHSKRRIFHVADHTGESIITTLLEQVKKLPNIEIVTNAIAIDLITDTHLKKQKNYSNSRCLGAYFYEEESGKVFVIRASITFLASGGASRVYRYTTNPSVNSGDGIAMAYRRGARIANMEFMQFHPTCLYHPKARGYLLSEAMRGEGAILKNSAGEAFLQKYHPMKELAPRDIVSLSIDKELKIRGDDCVYLDLTHLGSDFILSHFPNNYEKCKNYGFDLTKEPIPVVPAAHYTCGGVATNIDGETNITALFAAGEVAHSGVHGANRLASNSLLEAIVFSSRAAKKCSDVLQKTRNNDIDFIPPWSAISTKEGEEEIIIKHCWDEIRTFMWNYVGIVRTNRRLEYAFRRIQLLKNEVRQNYFDRCLSRNLLELRNLLTVAELIVRSAQMRKESRGLHQNLDYPELDNLHFRHDTIL